MTERNREKFFCCILLEDFFPKFKNEPWNFLVVEVAI